MSHRISIITPSFNQAQFLDETILSVVSQRQFAHEYFVVDGGSTDGSAEVIQTYLDKIDWWVSERDKGQSDAIHKGMVRATGDIVCWLNSDDIFLPGALARVQAEFDRDPSLDVVSGYLVLINAKSRVLSLPRVRSGSRFLARRGLVQISQQSTFFRRSLYERVGGLDLSLHCAMDLDLWSKFFAIGARWRHIPAFLAGFRKHGEAKGSGNWWYEKYQAEKAAVRSRYPELFGMGGSRRLAANLYRLSQIVSGRQLRSAIDGWRYKDLPVRRVFGEFTA